MTAGKFMCFWRCPTCGAIYLVAIGNGKSTLKSHKLSAQLHAVQISRD